MWTFYLIPHTPEAEAHLTTRYGGSTFPVDKNSGVDIPLPRMQFLPADQEPHKIDLQCTVRLVKEETPRETETSTTPPHYSAFWMAPRSSCSKKGERTLFLTNGMGLFDAGYTGNVIAQFVNLRNEETKIDAGTRLVQVAAPDLEPPAAIVVVKQDNVVLREKLLRSEDGRGAGAFGSTGEK